MVGREGVEPSTNGLRVHCSTNWANGPIQEQDERYADAIGMASHLLGNEMQKSPSRKTGFFVLVGRERFERSTNGLKVRCSTGWANDPVRAVV